MDGTKRIQFDITTATILKIIVAILLVWFFYVIREIVVLFFIVLVIVSALGPLVDRMSRYLPRALAVTILVLAFLGVLTAIGFLILPPLVNQITQMAINLPYFLDKFGPIYSNIQRSVGNYQEVLLNLSNSLGNVTSGIYSTTVGFITGIVGIVTILVMSFYMLLEQDSIKNFMHQTIPLEHKEKIFEIFRKIGEKMGSWLRGQAVLMFLMALLYGLVLGIVGIPYALTLAIWGGLMEVIPYVGPWLGIIPAAIVAFTVSPLKALLIIIGYVVIQQLESNFLAPKIMSRAVGLSPVVIMLALLAGAKIMGLLGIIIAVPTAGAIGVIIQEWPNLKKLYQQNNQSEF